jgi:hypothetical protein
MGKYYIQMPAKVTEILPTWEGNPPFKGFNIDNLRLILSIISTHQRKDDKGNIYAQLKAKYLRNIIWDYENYIRLLISANVVKKLGGYIPEEQSWRYCFTEAYLSPYKRSELLNQKIIRRIQKVKANQGRKNSREYPKQNHLIRSITINVPGAEKLSKEEYPDEVNKLNYALGSITRIQNKEFYHKVDETGKRLHTNLTNLPKFLKSQIKIKGQKISGVEIRNSQPYISTKFLSDPESTKEFFPGQLPLMMLKCLRLAEQKDVALFHLLVSQARFYKYLETEFNKQGCDYEVQSDPTKVSPELKNKVFQIFFDKNHHESKEKKIFHELFPGVNKAFSVLRMADYKNFSTALTRMESHVMLDVIIKRLNDEFSEMVATPIYDNVCTSIATNDIGTVSRVMKDELTKFIGIPPKLEIENFASR